MYKLFKNLWEEKHSVRDILTQCCFMFVAAFAFVMVPVVFSVIADAGFTFTDQSIAYASIFIMLSNICINLLSFLIIAEISQSLISGYFAYRKENL